MTIKNNASVNRGDGKGRNPLVGFAVDQKEKKHSGDYWGGPAERKKSRTGGKAILQKSLQGGTSTYK